MKLRVPQKGGEFVFKMQNKRKKKNEENYQKTNQNMCVCIA
jgi:hypothetical protein